MRITAFFLLLCLLATAIHAHRYHEKTRFDRSIDYENEKNARIHVLNKKPRIFADLETHFTAYKDASQNVCYLEKTRGNRLDELNFWTDVIRGNKKTLYASDHSLTKVEAWRLAGGRIVDFCKGMRIIQLTETKPDPSVIEDPFFNELPEDENDIIQKRIADVVLHPLKARAKRQALLEEREKLNNDLVMTERRKRDTRGKFRGQTQSQYMNVGANGQKDGRAEAEATQHASRAVVSGSSGMGQAQSMSTGSDGCDGCPGFSVPSTSFQAYDGVTTGTKVPGGTYIPGTQPGTVIPGGGVYPPGTQDVRPGGQIPGGVYPPGTQVVGQGGQIPGEVYPPGTQVVGTGGQIPGAVYPPGTQVVGPGGQIPGGVYPPGTQVVGPGGQIPGSVYFPGTQVVGQGGQIPGGVYPPGAQVVGPGRPIPGRVYPPRTQVVGPGGQILGGVYSPGTQVVGPGGQIPGGSQVGRGGGGGQIGPQMTGPPSTQLPGGQLPGGQPGVQLSGGQPGIFIPGSRPGIQIPGGQSGVQIPSGQPGVQIPGGTYPNVMIPSGQFGGGGGTQIGPYPPRIQIPGTQVPIPYPGGTYIPGYSGVIYPGPQLPSGTQIGGGGTVGGGTLYPPPVGPRIIYPPGTQIQPGGPYQPGTQIQGGTQIGGGGTVGQQTPGTIVYPPGSQIGGPGTQIYQPGTQTSGGSTQTITGAITGTQSGGGGQQVPGVYPPGTQIGGGGELTPGVYPPSTQIIGGTITGMQIPGGSNYQPGTQIYQPGTQVGGGGGPGGVYQPGSQIGGGTGTQIYQPGQQIPGGLYPGGQVVYPPGTQIGPYPGGTVPGTQIPGGVVFPGTRLPGTYIPGGNTGGGTIGEGGTTTTKPPTRGDIPGTSIYPGGDTSGGGVPPLVGPGVVYPPGTTVYPGLYPGGIPGQYPVTIGGQYPGTTGGQYPGTTGGQYPGTTVGQYPDTTVGQYPGITGGQYPGTIGEQYPGGGTVLLPGQVPGASEGVIIGTPGQTGVVPGQPGVVVAGDDNADSQAISSVKQTEGGTMASATAEGRHGQGSAKSHVSGTYTGSGAFAAEAGTSDNNKSAQTQVSGGKEGAKSSAQGSGGLGKSQVQVKLDSDSGATSTNAQSSGWNHGTNSQVQASGNGGMADAQANGEGQTSSQAQIGFQPYINRNEKFEKLKNPFRGGGSAMAQSGTYRGQSQSQLQGSFHYGISYTGAAQANSGSGSAALRKPFNFTNDPSLFKPFKFDKPESTTANMPKDRLEGASSTRQTVIAITSRNNQPEKKSKIEPTNKYSDEEEYEEEYDDEDYADTVSSTTPRLTTYPSSTPMSRQTMRVITDGEYDVSVEQQKTTAPTERSLPGYVAPTSQGKVVSIAGKKTIAQGDGKSQSQTVHIIPLNRTTPMPKVEIKHPSGDTRSLHSDRVGGIYYGNVKNPADEASSPKTSFVSVTNSVAGKMDEQSPTKKYEHRYYTKSSTCGYFTFSCNVVYGSNGRRKICKPKLPTYSDGTPKC